MYEQQTINECLYNLEIGALQEFDIERWLHLRGVAAIDIDRVTKVVKDTLNKRCPRY